MRLFQNQDRAATFHRCVLCFESRTQHVQSLTGSRIILSPKACGIILALAFLTLLPPSVRPQANPRTIESVVQALRAHDNSRALALCQELTRTDSGDPRLWTLEGMALEGLGRDQDSLNVLQHALEIDPDYVPALEVAAQIAFGLQCPKAQPLLERLIRLKPHNETAHAMLAAIAFRKKDCVVAISHFERGRDVISNNPAALAEFGACLVQTHRAAEAIPIFQRILDLRPGDWNSRYNLGLVQFRGHQYQAAIHILLPLTQGPRSNVTALNLIAAVYEANAQTPKAVAALRQAITLAPRDADNYLDLATISLNHGSYQVGVDVLDAALRLLPDSAPLYLERGVLLVQTGRYRDADADFEKAQALRPAQNYSAVALGISLLQENKTGLSLRVVKQRLAKSPDDPVLNYLLAEILIRQGVQAGAPAFNQAIAAARRAVQHKPDFAPAQDDLAELYLRSGRTRQAAQASELALKADPTDQSAIYHLIVCARKQGDRKELSQLVERLAGVSARAREQDAARSRFKLVEEGPSPSSLQHSN